MVELGYKNQKEKYSEYIDKYVSIIILPNGYVYYGKLKSFENRTAILNPYKGTIMKEGKLEESLIKQNLTLELNNLNVSIAEIPLDIIKKYCKNGNIQLRKAEKKLKSKSSHQKIK